MEKHERNACTLFNKDQGEGRIRRGAILAPYRRTVYYYNLKNRKTWTLLFYFFFCLLTTFYISRWYLTGHRRTLTVSALSRGARSAPVRLETMTQPHHTCVRPRTRIHRHHQAARNSATRCVSPHCGSRAATRTGCRPPPWGARLLCAVRALGCSACHSLSGAASSANATLPCGCTDDVRADGTARGAPAPSLGAGCAITASLLLCAQLPEGAGVVVRALCAVGGGWSPTPRPARAQRPPARPQAHLRTPPRQTAPRPPRGGA